MCMELGRIKDVTLPPNLNSEHGKVDLQSVEHFCGASPFSVFFIIIRFVLLKTGIAHAYI